MKHAVWSKIAELLSLSQFEKCMFLSYREKCAKVKQVSQSKKVHKLVDSLIEILDKESQNGIKAVVTTYETKTEIASKLNSLFGVK